jgi:mRNA interferase RelE/StbE
MSKQSVTSRITCASLEPILRKYQSVAARIVAKIEAYAADPAATRVKAMKGSSAARLRVGDFRVIFEETKDEVIVLDIGPRSGVYE